MAVLLNSATHAAKRCASAHRVELSPSFWITCSEFGKVKKISTGCSITVVLFLDVAHRCTIFFFYAFSAKPQHPSRPTHPRQAQSSDHPVPSPPDQIGSSSRWPPKIYIGPLQGQGSWRKPMTYHDIPWHAMTIMFVTSWKTMMIVINLLHSILAWCLDNRLGTAGCFFEHKISIQKPNMFRWPASRTASDASTRMKKAARAHLKDARNIWNMLEQH